jgi:hypothetical protein
MLKRGSRFFFEVAKELGSATFNYLLLRIGTPEITTLRA